MWLFTELTTFVDLLTNLSCNETNLLAAKSISICSLQVFHKTRLLLRQSAHLPSKGSCLHILSSSEIVSALCPQFQQEMSVIKQEAAQGTVWSPMTLL